MGPYEGAPSMDYFMDINDLAAYIGIPRQTLYQWRIDGRGPRASKLGRHLRYRKSDVESWLADQLGT